MLTQLYPLLNGNQAQIWVEEVEGGQIVVKIVPHQVVNDREPKFKTITMISDPKTIDSTEYTLQWPCTILKRPVIPEAAEPPKPKKQPKKEPDPVEPIPTEPTQESGLTPVTAVETTSESPASPSPEPSSSVPDAPKPAEESPKPKLMSSADKLKDLHRRLAMLNPEAA